MLSAASAALPAGFCSVLSVSCWAEREREKATVRRGGGGAEGAMKEEEEEGRAEKKERWFIMVGVPEKQWTDRSSLKEEQDQDL